MTGSNALKLVKTAASRPPTTLVSPAQSRSRQNMTTMAAAWKTTTIAQKVAWLEYDRMRITAVTPRKLNAYNAFININGTLLASNVPLNVTPPPAYVMPAGLPAPLTIDAAHPAANGAFTIKIMSAAYSGLVQVYATPQMLPGMDTRKISSHYVLITTHDGLDAAGTDITAAYVARYGIPDNGAMIAVSLVPVGDFGIRGTPLLVTGIVTGPTESALTGPRLTTTA